MKKTNCLKVLFLLFLLITLLINLSCFEDNHAIMDVNFRTTVTMTKPPYKNESTSGEIAFIGTIVYNLEKFVYEPLSQIPDISFNDIIFWLHNVSIIPKGTKPDISNIDASARFVKFEIFVQELHPSDNNSFHLFITTSDYIGFDQFWQGGFHTDALYGGVDLIREALNTREKEILFLFKITFVESFTEELSFDYFDATLTFPAAINTTL